MKRRRYKKTYAKYEFYYLYFLNSAFYSNSAESPASFINQMFTRPIENWTESVIFLQHFPLLLKQSKVWMHLILHNGDFKGFGDIFYKIVVLLLDLLYFFNGKMEGREIEVCLSPWTEYRTESKLSCDISLTMCYKINLVWS